MKCSRKVENAVRRVINRLLVVSLVIGSTISFVMIEGFFITTVIVIGMILFLLVLIFLGHWLIGNINICDGW